MDYNYVAFDYNAQTDVLIPRFGSVRRYELEAFLRRELEEKTTLGHLACFRLRGTRTKAIDPYEAIKVDPGEL